MKTVRNKTSRPLRVPLPQGKVLHLGPRQTGQVGHLDHPPLKKMIDAGDLEVVEDGGRGNRGGPAGSSGSSHSSTHGHVPTKVIHPSGDR